MKILITGAKGFIGSHLCNYLSKHGLAFGHYDVIGVDLSDGDLRNPLVPDYLIRTHAPDVVIHLAAQVGILFNDQDPFHAIDSNTTMTMRVAKACAKYGVKLIHTSTSEVYGDMGDAVLDEDTPLTGKATGVYAISKRWSEEAAREYAPDGLVIVRPSMPYGPGAPPGVGRRALDNMLWQAHHRKPIIVHRGSVRSWCWIDDLCAGYELILRNNAEGIFNIGRDDDYVSMFNIAQMACIITNCPQSMISVVEPPSKKIMVKKLSTAKIRSLGWQPTVNLSEGMPIVYEWVKQFKWVE